MSGPRPEFRLIVDSEGLPQTRLTRFGVEPYLSFLGNPNGIYAGWGYLLTKGK